MRNPTIGESASLLLDGKWTLTGTAPDGRRTIHTDAEVPGHVHLDLLRDGTIPDPFWRDNAEKCGWVESWSWEYRRTFLAPAQLNIAHTWAVLEVDGIDAIAHVTLNGVSVGATRSMHIGYRFDVSDSIRAGENVIVVSFRPVAEIVAGKRLDYPNAFDRPERVHIRRMQCTFHWDWVHRFVSYGIWRSVRLRVYDRLRLTDVWVRPTEITPEHALVEVALAWEDRGAAAAHAGVLLIDPSGRVCAEEHLRLPTGGASWDQRREEDGPPPSTSAARYEDTHAAHPSSYAPQEPISTTLRLRIDRPSLWWPTGYGDQPLYTCRVCLFDGDSVTLDSREVTFGIRTVSIEQPIDAPGSSEESETRRLRSIHGEDARNTDVAGSGFIVCVNGRRIFCRGGNWVPADPWPSRIDAAWYDSLLQLVREGNMNTLRVWGGGISEPPAFWDGCDRLGILVCRDFPFACASYPEDDEDFMNVVREETPEVIRAIRNHPSLAWWVGDNENRLGSDFDDPNAPGRKIADEVTGPACARLDPDRPFFATSPIGGRPNNALTIGDCHASYLPTTQSEIDAGLDAYKKRIENAIGRFQSECTTMGSPTTATLLTFMDDRDIVDPTGAMWEYHTKDNPYLELSLHAILRGLSTKLFNPASSDSPQRHIARMEYVQYEWVRLLMEAARRKKWYCGGLLTWMYNDCWPASGWSLVDYYARPKAGWYAMKRACAGVICSVREGEGGYEVHVCNESRSTATGTVTVRFQPWAAQPLWTRRAEFSVDPSTARVVYTLPHNDYAPRFREGVLVVDIAGEFGADRSWFFGGMPYEMTPPPATLVVDRSDTDRHADQGVIVVSTDRYARVVTVEGADVLDDNYFDLLPGERRTIRWRRHRSTNRVSQPEARPIRVSCWNDAHRQPE